MKIYDRLSSSIHAATAMALVCDDGFWQERGDRLRQHSSLLKRMTSLAIHNAVRTNPQSIRDSLVRQYESRGYEVLGIGANSTVLRMGDTALKLIRSTTGMNPEIQEKYVSYLDTRQGNLLEHMSDFCLKQEFEISRHPIYENKNLVVGRQPVVEDFMPIRLYQADTLVNLSDRQRHNLAVFGQRALKMWDESGVLVDIAGADNIGFSGSEDSVVLIDTIPMIPNAIPRWSITQLQRISASC